MSESSVKRWTDDGAIVCSRTVGGHRRVSLAEAVRFVRRSGTQVVRPDLLGLPDHASLPAKFSDVADPTEALYTALEAGHASTVRGMLQAMYLSGRSLAGVFDGPVRQAMARIGELWLHAEWGLVVEHRATNILIGALSTLRTIMPGHDQSAPVAVGCAAEHDTYVVPSLMASLVMAEAGFTDVNLGPMTPSKVLINAAKYYHARVAWLSVSVPWPVGPSVTGEPKSSGAVGPINDLARVLAAEGTQLVVGGRGLGAMSAASVTDAVVAGSMVELAALARALRLSPSAAISGVEGSRSSTADVPKTLDAGPRA